MKTMLFSLCVSLAWTTCTASARSYIPIGDGSGYDSIGSLQSVQAAGRAASRAVRAVDRPQVSGARPVEVELLEDALRRKQPRTIGNSTEKAYESIVRNSLRDPVKRSHIRGMLAEARFLHENPDWGYVRSPTASQHDVYRWARGRSTPYTAQIKTHGSGDAATYARDMRIDFRSDRFLVPDDHVSRLRHYWREEIARAESRGLSHDVAEARRQLHRVRGLGFTNANLDDDLSRASRYILRQQGRTYVSLGAGRGLVLNSGGKVVLRTSPMSMPPGARTARPGGGIRAERLRTMSFSEVGARYARLAWRGIAGLGIAWVILDTSRFLHSYGDVDTALRSPHFYTRIGGTVGGLAVGLSVGGNVASHVTAYTAPMVGWWSVVLGGGAGLITGTLTGVAGYIGGESATRFVIEFLKPELLRQGEAAAIDDARNTVTSKIRQAQASSD